MKNRKRQRANRRIKEELLELRDSCGVKDPTPYEAIKLIIRNQKNFERGTKRNEICTTAG